MKMVTQEWEELPGKARCICSWALELRRSLPDFPGKEEHFRQKKSTDGKWWWFDLLGNGVVRGERKETDTVEHPLFITRRKRSQSGGRRGKKNQPSLWDPERQSTVTQLAGDGGGLWDPGLLAFAFCLLYKRRLAPGHFWSPFPLRFRVSLQLWEAFFSFRVTLSNLVFE